MAVIRNAFERTSFAVTLNNLITSLDVSAIFPTPSPCNTSLAPLLLALRGGEVGYSAAIHVMFVALRPADFTSIMHHLMVQTLEKSTLLCKFNLAPFRYKTTTEYLIHAYLQSSLFSTSKLSEIEHFLPAHMTDCSTDSK